MPDLFLVGWIVCFALFAILAVYAALKGSNILLGGMLVCLVGSGAASIYAIHLQSVGTPELEQKVFVAVDLNGINNAESGEPAADDAVLSPENAARALLLAEADAVSAPAVSQSELNASASQSESDASDANLSEGLDVGVVTHTEDFTGEVAGAPSVPITKYVISDLSDTGGVSPIEWEDRLRREHLVVIEKRYRELLESQGRTGGTAGGAGSAGITGGAAGGGSEAAESETDGGEESAEEEYSGSGDTAAEN
jgi:hypothetical protein